MTITQHLLEAKPVTEGKHHFIGHVEVIGEGLFETDGHCSFSPDRRWMLTDTYPDDSHMQTLILYEPTKGKRFDIGRFCAPPVLTGPIRCDFHPCCVMGCRFTS